MSLSTEPPRAAAPPVETVFRALLRAKDTRTRLYGIVTGLARRWLIDEDVKEAVGLTFVNALEKDAAGTLWDPATDVIEHKLKAILQNVLKDGRRWRYRKGTVPLPESYDQESPYMGPDELYDEARLTARLRGYAAELRAGGLGQGALASVAVGILDAAKEGILDKRKLSERLSVDIRQVYKAQELLMRRGRELSAKKAGAS